MTDQPSGAVLTKDEQIAGLTQLVNTLNAKLAQSNTLNYDLSNPEIMKKVHDVQVAALNREVAYYNYGPAMYQWELFASNIILWVTVVVVMSGLAFAGMQLWNAMRAGKKLDGTWEISAKGVRVTSSVVGVVVLAMSIAFVFLFLDRVYPVK